MTFVVIKQIEVPERQKIGAKPHYPFANLEVGDGFDCPRFAKFGKAGRRVDRYNTLHSSARAWGERHKVPGYKVSVYLLDNNMLRVVRVA